MLESATARRVLVRMLYLVPVALGLLAPRLAAMDGDTNGVSDVWSWHYGVTNMAPGDDPDGDGQDNLFESVAGTHPLDPYSRFSAMAGGEPPGGQTNVVVSWWGVAGKRYEVWYSYNLLDWELFDGPFAGEGTNLSLIDEFPPPGEMMMSAPDPLGEALSSLAEEGLVPKWEPYPSWAPNQPPKPPLQLYFVSACALDNGLTSMYFWEATEDGMAHYLVLSNIPLRRLPGPQQWLDRDGGYGAIFLDIPYAWKMFSWYWDIQDAGAVEGALLSAKEFTWTSAPFERFAYRAPSGWVLDYLTWMHRYFGENAERFAEEMIAHEKALAGIEDPASFELSMSVPQDSGGDMGTLSLEPDDTKKFYRVHTIPSLDGDEDGLDAYEEGLVGTSDATSDSDGDGVADGTEFANGLCPTNSVDADLDAMPDDWEMYHFGALARSTAPKVTWMRPTHGAVIAVGTDVYLIASVTDTDVVSRVDFFADGTNVGHAASHPYAVTWSNAAPGTHWLHAEALFGQGAITGSAPVSVSIIDPLADDDADGLPDAWESEMFGDLSQDGDDDFDGDGFNNLAEYQAGTDPADYFNRPGGAPNAPPIISMGPDQAIIWPTNSVLLGATAEDSDEGPAALTSLWSVVSGPLGVVIANPGATNTLATFSQTGDYVFRFEASDGIASRSGLVAVHVTVAPVNPPTVRFIGPADGSTIPMGEGLSLWVEAGDTDGDVEEVRLYRNAVLIGTLVTPPYVMNWTETELGAVTFSAVAVDNDGNSSAANTTLLAYPGGIPPGGGGGGTPGPSPGKFKRLTVPSPDTGPLAHGATECTVTTDEEDPVTEQHQIDGVAGQLAILEVVVSSEEYDAGFTEEQSEYNDMVEWSVTAAWAGSHAGSCSVNSLHNKFVQSPTHEAVVARFLVCFPDSASRAIQFRATVQNVADGALDTTVSVRMFRVGWRNFKAIPSEGQTQLWPVFGVFGPVLIPGLLELPAGSDSMMAEVRVVQNVAPHVEEYQNDDTTLVHSQQDSWVMDGQPYTEGRDDFDVGREGSTISILEDDAPSWGADSSDCWYVFVNHQYRSFLQVKLNNVQGMEWQTIGCASWQFQAEGLYLGEALGWTGSGQSISGGDGLPSVQTPVFSPLVNESMVPY